MNIQNKIAKNENVPVLAGELRALVGKFKRRLREQSHTCEFTPSQISVILRLEREGPATVSDLARAEGVRPQSMRATIKVLISQHCIQVVPDPDDGRKNIISLTSSWQKRIKKGREAREDWLIRNIERNYNSSELEVICQAVDLLKRIVEN